MRLLHCNKTGEFSLTEDLTSNEEIPSYAILSHTWGADADEVTFDDLTNGTGKDKPGFKKIRFCQEQATQDGLRYFWVDTCCINKANKAELSHAINSMFRWYRNAEKCYVYLPDVSTYPSTTGKECNSWPWQKDFQRSKWFTRGWTLQELLAPTCVQFFSREWHLLGDKFSLIEQVHAITGVPKSALQGNLLSQFTVNERLSWINHRQTKLEEDKAYSLLGLFDIYVPPIYGEGTASAFRRLREEIAKLEQCMQDLHLSNPRDDKKRIEDTKGGLLKDSYRWILSNSDFRQWRNDPQSRLLWIKGDPGKGKTMLLCGIVNELNDSMVRTDTLSYFFCQATDSRINSATAVLRGLMYMLVQKQPSLAYHIREKYDQVGKALFEDTNAWIALSSIFNSILQDPSLYSTYLIVDALDECASGLPELLDLILTSCVAARVRWVVSSRNWPDIEERLEKAGNKVRLSLELNAESIATAVSIFIQHKVHKLADRKTYDDKTRVGVLDYLSANADNTFLWVALVCQNLEDIPGWMALAKLISFPPGLNSLYERMMEHICNSGDAELCKQILTTIAIVYRPITLRELTSLVEVFKGVADDLNSLRKVIGLCGSFLTVRGETVYFVHQSAKDFLLAKDMSEIFPSGTEEAHHLLFMRSLQAMSKTLRRDMYGLAAPGFPITEVQVPVQDPLATMQYSCLHWVDHFCDWSTNSANHCISSQDQDAIENFISKKYLYWLEALSLYGSMSKGVLAIAKLSAFVQGRVDAPSFMELLQDARLFIMYHIQAIQNSPLQAYISALIFTPEHSLIRRCFKREEPKWIPIKPAIGDQWSACLLTLKGHTNSVKSIDFSHDSARLASASSDTTVKIWDASSGKCVQTLQDHSRTVNSVAFSHNSAWLASASDDKTIKIWDASSSKCVQTLEDHRGAVNSVAFSHDSAWLASASDDKTIKIWDASSGNCLRTLIGHTYSVWSVSFSHNSAWLASASDDNTIKIWDASNGKCLRTLKGHTDLVGSVAFSNDLTQLASGSKDKTIKLWDASSGNCRYTLKDHSDSVKSVAFSHDSTRLASASDDRTVKIWDARNGKCLQTFQGHSYHAVLSVAFSHDSARLASGSDDDTVKIWDVGSTQSLQTFIGYNNLFTDMAFSPDSALLVSAWDKTVKIWDASNGKCLQTLKEHSKQVTSVAFSHDSTRLASASDKMVKIWDVSNGKCLQTLKGHTKSVSSVAFSHDSTRLASASDDTTVKIWDVSSGKWHQRVKLWDVNISKCLQTFKGHRSWVTSVAFSPDSTRLASTSYRTVKIWDASNGKCLKTLNTRHSAFVTSVAFSHDSRRLASSSEDGTVKIWYASTDECLQTIMIGKASRRMLFDIDDSSLHTDIGTIKISALPGSRSHLSHSDPQSPRYQGVALNANGAWITYNSEKLIRLRSEYRPGCSAVSGKMIGIGFRNSMVWICKIERA